MEYHFAPDFLNLLVEAIPRLNKSKRDVLLFFQGAGVPVRYLDDLRADLKRDKDSHNKFDLARTVLVRLNEGGDAALSARREVVKRIVEFEDFTRCWSADVLEAKGLVAEVQRVRNVKDSFTRMNIEREREREQAKSVRDAEMQSLRLHRERIEAIKQKLFALFADSDPHRRGKALEGILNELFATWEISVRDAFTLKANGEGIIEQIDGVIELDRHLYLVETKWFKEPLGPGDTAQHLVRVYSREGVRGLFISASGYTPATVHTYKEALAQRTVVLCTLEEIVTVLNNASDLKAFLRAKVKAALLDKEPFLKLA